ncbi:MAG: hypothetical protein K2X77_03595 [Candidatus Obscuribacterales bacterium]|jgi:hypothetical protein|nr:hypothetical protein [Candidatus Obscuribacterales bacterium]
MSIARDNFESILSGDKRPSFSAPESPIDWLSGLEGFGAPARTTDKVPLNVDNLANTILSTNGFGDGNSREQIKNELIHIIDNGSVWSLARELNQRLQAAGSDLTVTGEIQPYIQHTNGKPPVPYVAGHQAILTIKRGDDFVDRVQAMRLKDPNHR